MLPSELLRRDGWCQFTALDEKGQRCAMGVTMEVFSPHNFVAVEDWAVDLEEVLGLSNYFGGWGAVITWNNTPGRTAEEVIAAFEQVERNRGLREQMTMDDLIAPFKERVHVAK